MRNHVVDLAVALAAVTVFSSPVGTLADTHQGTFQGTLILTDGEQVVSGCDCREDWLLVENSDIVVVQRRNGDFQVHQASNPDEVDDSTTLLWSSNAMGPVGDYVTTLQSDCNLVTTVGNDTATGSILWTSETTLIELENNTSCFMGITQDMNTLQIWQGLPQEATQLLQSFPTQTTAAPTDAPTGPKRPNILLITTDDMNYDSVGVYGCPVEGTTPNIDRLASEGIQFEYGFVNIAVCSPSRHVLLTGRHSHQTMTRGWTIPEHNGPTLPGALKAGGYVTSQINKLQPGYNFDFWVNEGQTAWGRQVSYTGQLMRQIIQGSGDKPWFSVYNLNDPHRAFHGAQDESKYSENLYKRFSTPSRVYNASEIVVPGFLPDLPDVRTEIAQYYSSVRRADDNVGALLDAVEQAGQTNHTIVVFLSDHGMSNPFAKLSCYQNGLRVPFILRYPPLISAGSRDMFNMVSAVDLAPTLLELVGLDVPPTMAGRSFVPLLQGELQNGRDYVIGYYVRNLVELVVYPMVCVQSREWVYIYSPWVDGETIAKNSDFGGGLTWKAMVAASNTNASIKSRTDFHRYRIRHELYNLRQDPQAYVNLAYEEESREQVQAMRQILVGWMEETDHPAKELMKDPDNEDLISDYLEWERQNALAQNLEQNITKTSSARRSHHWRSSLVSVLWIWAASRVLR